MKKKKKKTVQCRDLRHIQYGVGHIQCDPAKKKSVISAPIQTSERLAILEGVL